MNCESPIGEQVANQTNEPNWRFKLPISLRIVAYLFIVYGVISLVELIGAIRNAQLNFNIGLIGIFIGFGLLRLSNGWRKCALCFLFLGLAIIPICTICMLVTSLGSSSWGMTILWIDAVDVKPWKIVVVMAAYFIMVFWQCCVLNYPPINDLFTNSTAIALANKMRTSRNRVLVPAVILSTIGFTLFTNYLYAIPWYVDYRISRFETNPSQAGAQELATILSKWNPSAERGERILMDLFTPQLKVRYEFDVFGKVEGVEMLSPYELRFTGMKVGGYMQDYCDNEPEGGGSSGGGNYFSRGLRRFVPVRQSASSQSSTQPGKRRVKIVGDYEASTESGDVHYKCRIESVIDIDDFVTLH